MNSLLCDRKFATYVRGWLQVLCLAALILPPGAQALTVSLAQLGSPGPVSVAFGETIRLELIVAGVPVEGLVAFQVALTFDPTSIQLADPNAAFVSGGIKLGASHGSSC